MKNQENSQSKRVFEKKLQFVFHQFKNGKSKTDEKEIETKPMDEMKNERETTTPSFFTLFLLSFSILFFEDGSHSLLVELFVWE